MPSLSWRRWQQQRRRLHPRQLRRLRQWYQAAMVSTTRTISIFHEVSGQTSINAQDECVNAVNMYFKTHGTKGEARGRGPPPGRRRWIFLEFPSAPPPVRTGLPRRRALEFLEKFPVPPPRGRDTQGRRRWEFEEIPSAPPPGEARILEKIPWRPEGDGRREVQGWW